MNTPHLPNTLLFCLVTWSTGGCHIADTPITRQEGGPCAEQGARVGDLTCDSGTWTQSPMAMLDMTQSPDQATPDMPEDLAECVPETDAEICASLNRCAIEMSVVDNCEEVRQVRCPDRCAQGICIPATGLCEGDCTPQACPPTLTCGRASNGCGAMQLCDTCPDNTVCNPNTLECECEALDPADVCGDIDCGETLEMDTCGNMVAVPCGVCETGTCQSNTCVLLEEMSNLEPLANELFGASISRGQDYILVGAPGEQASYVGNAYLLKRAPGQSWAIEYEARDDRPLFANYDGYRMGTSVAFNSTYQFAVIGKVPDGPATPTPSNEVSVLRQGTDLRWQVLDIAVQRGSEPVMDIGAQVATAGTTIALTAPQYEAAQGHIEVLNADVLPLTEDMFTSTSYEGSGPGELPGTALALTSTQLVYNSPINDGGRCHLARLNSDMQTWSNALAITADSPPMTSSVFCQHVALTPNVLAATLYGRRVNNVDIDVVQLFVSPDNGLSWTFLQEIIDPRGEANRGFGSAMAFINEGADLLIGDPQETLGPGLEEAGIVYHYTRQEDGTYRFVDEIRANTPEEGARFGTSITAHERDFSISAPGQTVNTRASAGMVFHGTLSP